MTRITKAFLVTLLLLVPPMTAQADEKELRSQRLAAQNDRQKQVNERSREINDANRAFRDYTRDLKVDYRDRLKDLDTDFELRRVELQADHKARVASAEAEYQKKLTTLFMNPDGELNDDAVQKMQNDAKAYSDALFELKKQSAEEVHAAHMENEKQKNELLNERDQQAMEEAAALGLDKSYAPVLATPIGGALTRQETQWNEREKKKVAQLEERNRKTTGEFRNGEKLRTWEMENMSEDFQLTWDEKARLHALESQQNFYNTLFMQAAQGKQIDQQKIMADMAELGEKRRLINIEFRKIKDKNRIIRREERKEILAQ